MCDGIDSDGIEEEGYYQQHTAQKHLAELTWNALLCPLGMDPSR
jgi:hypothetical protein